MAPDLDALKCQVCNLAEPEDNFLLCDGCAHGFHAPCLGQQMPDTRFWFCPDCNGTTVKGCVIQVLEKGGLAGLTPAELNAGVLALRVKDLDAEELSPDLVAVYNNTTVRERSRLVHGVHGRLDDGRCLVERLAPDDGVVRFRLTPEESRSPQVSEGLAAPSAPEPASPTPLTEPAQAVNNAAATAAAGAAGAQALSLYEDITPAQNLNKAGRPAVEPRPASSSQGTDSAESPCVAQSAQSAPQSMCPPENEGFTRLAEKTPGPSVHGLDAAHGICLRLEAKPGPLAPPPAGPLTAPRSPRPLMSRHSSDTVSVTFEGASLGTACTKFALNSRSAPAGQTQLQGSAETSMGDLDQLALYTRPADQANGTHCLQLRCCGRHTESDAMQDEEVLSDGPAAMESALQQQLPFGPGPPIQDTCEPDTVLPDSVEESPNLKQMEIGMGSASDEEDRNADCVPDNMVLDPIYHKGVHKSNDSCAKGPALGLSATCAYEQGQSMQQQDKGSSSMHAMALPNSRDAATDLVADAQTIRPAAAHLPANPVGKSYQARTDAAQALMPETPAVIPVNQNKRKRQEDTAEQGAPSSKQRCQATGWSSFCSDTLLSIYRVVLILWLVRDMLNDKP